MLNLTVETGKVDGKPVGELAAQTPQQGTFVVASKHYLTG
jgi:hypothetical protein